MVESCDVVGRGWCRRLESDWLSIGEGDVVTGLPDSGRNRRVGE